MMKTLLAAAAILALAGAADAKPATHRGECPSARHGHAIKCPFASHHPSARGQEKFSWGGGVGDRSHSRR